MRNSKRYLHLQYLQHYIKIHSDFITLIFGSLIICSWTLLRFYTQPLTFDMVGQQVLASQWLNGNTSHSYIGITNYLYKMITIYMPLEIMHINPLLGLIISTLLINVLTFVLLFILLKKILIEFEVKPTIIYNYAMLWVAAISPSVFWIQHSNSRNLEVVGGVFLILLWLRFMQNPLKKYLFGFTLLSTLLFFADTLQFYMIAIPLIIFSTILSVKDKVKPIRLLILLSSTLMGYMLSRILLTTMSGLFHTTIISSTSNKILFSFNNALYSFLSTGKSLAFLFSGYLGNNYLVAINLVFIFLMFLLFVVAVYRKLIAPRLSLFVFVFITENILVYIISNQSNNPANFRYLIMIAPIIVVVITSLNRLSKLNKIVANITLVVVFSNIFGLCLALQNHSQITNAWQHFSSVNGYISSHPNYTFYASMDTSLPLNFLSTNTKNNMPLPLACENGILSKSYLFFDRNIFKANDDQSKNIAILLDKNSINNFPNTCNISDVIKQLGNPEKTDITNDQSKVLIYKRESKSVRNLLD